MTGGQVSGGELAHQLSCNRSLRLGERKRPTTSPADDCTDVVSSLFLNDRGVHSEGWGGEGGRGGEERRRRDWGERLRDGWGRGEKLRGREGVAVRVMERCSDRMRNGVQKEWEEVSRSNVKKVDAVSRKDGKKGVQEGW